MRVISIILFLNNSYAKLYDSKIISFMYPDEYTEIRDYADKTGIYIALTSKEDNVITVKILNSFDGLLKVAKRNVQETKKTLRRYSVGKSKFDLPDNNKYQGAEELLEKFNISIFFQNVLTFRHYIYKKYKNKYIVIIVQGVDEDYSEVMQKANPIILSIFSSIRLKE